MPGPSAALPDPVSWVTFGLGYSPGMSMKPGSSTTPLEEARASLVRRLCLICGALVGCALAMVLYGTRILSPTSVDWLRGENDPLRHFVGWQTFRQDAWRLPIGLNPKYGTLIHSSIVYCDSTPLIAIVCKALRALLPFPFQYVGLVLCVNFGLTGAVAAGIAYELTNQAASALLFSVLAVTQPWTTARGVGAHGHESLTATWILWLAVWFLGTEVNAERRPTRTVHWAVLLLISATIHFYLLLMVFAFWLGSRATALVHASAWGYRVRLGLEAATVLVCTLGTMWVIGYWAIPASKDTFGFGYYSAELLTFIKLTRARTLGSWVRPT